MFYRKNIYRWEQIVRIVAGVAVALYAFFAMPFDTVSTVLMAVGAVAALSGVFGFCPAYALMGRKLKQPPQ